jgi:hypothetical protein
MSNLYIIMKINKYKVNLILSLLYLLKQCHNINFIIIVVFTVISNYISFINIYKIIMILAHQQSTA